MNSIFERTTIDQFTERLNELTPYSKPEWGKMTVYQMLKHCTENEKMNLRITTYKRLLPGRLFGRMVMNKIIKDDLPMSKNNPTHPALKIKGDGDFETQRKELINLLNKYPSSSKKELERLIHPFFGKLKLHEWEIYIYKHLDHHLRQFGV
ncbi:MAG: hypothetical protein Pars93KO_26420 [Parasphingorhabdus sp.]